MPEPFVTFRTESDGFADMIAELEGGMRVMLQALLTSVGAETVAYLRSLTGEMRPPVGAQSSSPFSRRTRSAGGGSNIVQRRMSARSSLGSGGPRRAHPGHWADVTSNLANAYTYEVEVGDDYGQLMLRNGMEYAAYLEAKAGYFVLSGVMQDDGPVDRAIRKTLAAIAPDWTVYISDQIDNYGAAGEP